VSFEACGCSAGLRTAELQKTTKPVMMCGWDCWKDIRWAEDDYEPDPTSDDGLVGGEMRKRCLATLAGLEPTPPKGIDF
jgi:hypothetical protein